MRAAIYARYSSDNQRDASIADQLRICREFAERQGWQIAEEYTDHAVSGASLLRPGMQALIADAALGRFHLVLSEAMDRLSRDQEDIAGLFKRMAYADVKIVTLSEGEVTALHVGLKGTMNSLFLKDLADKTRRGLRGRIEQGKSGGGNSYGYDVVHTSHGDGSVDRGERRINPVEAATITEIFERYTQGASPRAIAKHLNDEGIPGPSGKAWGASTINGNVTRGTGILNNELYIGRLIWNRLRYVKDPETGKRVSRLNPESAWIITDVPELRIISDALWQRVKDRQQSVKRDSNGERPFWDRRRPRYLLSGLVTCGCCGGGYTAVGRTHLGCATSRDKGTCDNKATIKREVLEDMVLDGLRHHLMAPELFAVFCDEFTKEFNRLNREKQASRSHTEAELHKVERSIHKLIEAIMEGIPALTIKDKMIALEARKQALQADLAAVPSDEPLLHPNMSTLYRRKVEELTTALLSEETRATAFELIRSLIDGIVLTPHDGDLKIDLTGSLAGILSLCSGSRKAAGGVSDGLMQVKLVAGARFELTTFRL